jgi:hypothetical protein
MITVSFNNVSLSYLSEDSNVLRNDILLPKIPVSCIVVGERGFSVCPDRPLFTRTNLATGSTPQIMPSALPAR